MKGTGSAIAKGYLPPDVEAHLTGLIEGAGVTGCRVFTVDVTALWPEWVTSHVVQVDARASDKQKAHDKAWEVARLVMASTAIEGGTITNVGIASGPSWIPDENGAPRYVARYIFTVHPHQTKVPE